MATTRMVVALVRSLQTITLGAVMMLSMTVLLPAAVHADTYGAGMYGNDIYNGSGTGTSTTSTTTPNSGGGTCTNCGSASVSSHTSATSTSTSSTANTSASTTTSTATNGGGATTTPFTCASVATGGDLSLAQLVNLFVSLGIIPADKAAKACNAVTAGGVKGGLPLVQFSKPLKLGDRDAQVRMLQAFLNTHGFVVATSGPGSSGNETDLYGPLTKNAVARFQAAYKAEILTPVGLTLPSGIFGPSSMKKANALLGSK